MAELPTATAPSSRSDVTSALRQIEAARVGAGRDVADCLDAIGDLIRITGAPASIFAWVRHTFAVANLQQYAAQQHLKLHESRTADEDQAPRTFVIWTAGGEGLAIIPGGQDPATSLLQLREEVAQRDEEVRLTADFQASMTAGHVEGVDEWFTRAYTRAGK